MIGITPRDPTVLQVRERKSTGNNLRNSTALKDYRRENSHWEQSSSRINANTSNRYDQGKILCTSVFDIDNTLLRFRALFWRSRIASSDHIFLIETLYLQNFGRSRLPLGPIMSPYVAAFPALPLIQKVLERSVLVSEVTVQVSEYSQTQTKTQYGVVDGEPAAVKRCVVRPVDLSSVDSSTIPGHNNPVLTKSSISKLKESSFGKTRCSSTSADKLT